MNHPIPMLGLAICLGILVTSCTQKVAGGGSSGSEAGNALTAKFVLTDGSPVSGARITLRPANFTAGDASIGLTAAETDAKGQVELNDVAAGSWVIVASAPGKSLLRTIVIPSTDSSINLGCDTLRGLASASGSTAGHFTTATRVVVRGTDFETPIAADGSYQFESLPVGVLTFETKSTTETRTAYVRTAPEHKTEIATLEPESFGTLLLDNFEDQDLQHRLGSLTSGGWWYLAKHPSVTLQNSFTENIIPLNYTGDSHGTAIHADFTFDGADPNVWAEIGVSIGLFKQPHDFSSVDSLAFFVRGTGKLELVLRSALDPEVSWTTSIPMEENGVWVRKAFSLAVLCPLEERKHLTGFSWRAVSAANFWIDDVQLIGGNRSQIWP